MDMHYRIGEFSRLSGVSIKALRYYDQIGLLKPAAVDPRNQYRFYVSRQLQDLAAIGALKDLGASLDDIRRVLGRTESGQARRKLLEQLRRRAERSMAAARQSLIWIEGALEGLSDGQREVAVVVKQRPAVRVASIRAQVKCYAEIDVLERALQRSIVSGLAGASHGVLWHRCAESGSIEGEPFVEVSTRAPRSGAYELKELPAAAVATAYCEPDEHDAERTYEALNRWVRLHNYRLTGPKREIYVGQILEIQFPVTPV
jgi:DNA-binding transcriptional MerR regulator